MSPTSDDSTSEAQTNTASTRSRACVQCAGPMVSISLRVTSGTRTMYSCSNCDRRVWVAEGDATALRSVLAELSDTDVPRRNSRALTD